MNNSRSTEACLEALLKGVTTAIGKVVKVETYSISLKLGKIRNNAVKLQKETVRGWEDVNEGEDLFQIGDEPLSTGRLRIIVEDNTGSDLIHRRRVLYGRNRRRLSGILNFSIPFKLEVRKFHKDQQLPVRKSDNIRAVITVVDPEEDVSHVKGVFPTPIKNSGKGFITLFNSRIRSLSIHDNCAEDLAPNILKSRCRKAKAGGMVRANRILFHHSGKALPPDPNLNSTHSVIVDGNYWQEESDSNGDFITSNIDFRPPPILGDNYIFKIHLEKGPNYVESTLFINYKNGKDKYETPRITIWRKIKVELFIQGRNKNDTSVYNEIKWDEIKRAYSDAYIELEYPTRPSSSQQGSQNVYYIIPVNQWINYLDRFIYRRWRKSAWNRFRSQQNQQLQQDLTNYSFPQKLTVAQLTYTAGSTVYQLGNSLKGISIRDILIEGVTNGSPTTYTRGTDFRIMGSPNNRRIQWLSTGLNPDVGTTFTVYSLLAPSDDVTPTSWDLLGKLANRIVRDVLKKERGITAHPNNSVSTIDSFYILACKPPRPDSRVCGRFEGGKLFYIVIGGDSTCTLTHEMGHALFLDHGATCFIEKPLVNSKSKIPIVVKYKKSGEEGPYWDLHHSEDMISCVMSYGNDYHGVQNSVNWHFCGVCLLLLRFYDEVRLRRSSVFRDIQYTLKNMRIAHFIKSATGIFVSLSSSLQMKKGDKKYLLVLYPKEGVINNRGYDYYKDVSTHPRGRWRFVDPNTYQDVPSNRRVVCIRRIQLPGGVVLAKAKAIRKGSNIVLFEIQRDSNSFVQSSSLTIEVK